MLIAVSIRNIVLIDALDLSLEPGLCALTGETGAGKSILLDALGLAMGGRADKKLVRHGNREGSVTAVFALESNHAAFDILKDHDIARGEPGELILRRIQSADGRSRAFINDCPVSVRLLQQVGETLIEIHGQHDERGLLNPSGHRQLLDEFGGLFEDVRRVAEAHAAWRDAVKAHDALAEAQLQAQREQEYLSHVVRELDELDPQEGEEEALASERALLMSAEKIASDLDEATQALIGNNGLTNRLNGVLRRLERAAGEAEGRLAPVTAALERALVEAAEAESTIEEARQVFGFDAGRLAEAEDRLFAMRAAARKHQVRPDELPALREKLQAQLDDIATAGSRLEKLAEAALKAQSVYAAAARALSEKRRAAAETLDAAVAAELAPLKLEKASFRTCIEPVAEDKAGAEGLDRVRFEVSTNPGAPFGDLIQIASGGELSRFLLALKVSLAGKGTAGCLIFDEIDRGVGGAVAEAIGDRLARLALPNGADDGSQVLVVTHAPQVAARAQHQWQISKSHADGQMVTRVDRLDNATRLEEIARMLAGAEVTDEARAAAARLIDGAARSHDAQAVQAT